MPTAIPVDEMVLGNKTFDIVVVFAEWSGKRNDANVCPVIGDCLFDFFGKLDDFFFQFAVVADRSQVTVRFCVVAHFVPCVCKSGESICTLSKAVSHACEEKRDMNIWQLVKYRL